MVIEILYFDGCPNHAPVLARLRDLIQRHGITAEIVQRDVGDPASAERERFLGSPTVRVDGHDIEPGARDRLDFGLKCRIYRTPAGLTGAPTDEWILDALRPGSARSAGGREPRSPPPADAEV